MPPTILSIDDNKDNLLVLEALLCSVIPDCRVINSLAGKDGLEKAESEHPDTILLDIRMPEMNGFEVCGRLKSNNSTKHIPVIMLTATRSDAIERTKALDSGADAFLSKPVDTAELAAQVNAMLRIKKSEDLLRSEKDFL
jgi:CheY-like chemotaxis protein